MKLQMRRRYDDPCCLLITPALLSSPALIHLLPSPGYEGKLSLSRLLLLSCLLECWVSRKDGVKYLERRFRCKLTAAPLTGAL